MERASVGSVGEEEDLDVEWGEVVLEPNLHMMTATKDWSTNVSSLFTDFSKYTNSKGYEQITRSTFKTMSHINRIIHTGDK